MRLCKGVRTDVRHNPLDLKGRLFRQPLDTVDRYLLKTKDVRFRLILNVKSVVDQYIVEIDYQQQQECIESFNKIFNRFPSIVGTHGDSVLSCALYRR